MVIAVLAAGGVFAAVTAGLPTVYAFAAPTFSWPYRLALLAALLVPFVAARHHCAALGGGIVDGFREAIDRVGRNPAAEPPL